LPPREADWPRRQVAKLDLQDLEGMNLDEKNEQLGQGIDQLLQVLSKKDAGPIPGPKTI